VSKEREKRKEKGKEREGGLPKGVGRYLELY
jgi:hypothetical protein